MSDPSVTGISEHVVLWVFGGLAAVIAWLVYGFVKHVIHCRDLEVKLGRVMQKLGMKD